VTVFVVVGHNEAPTLPAGKGRAVAVAFQACGGDEPVCFVDGDTVRSECNIPATLRDAFESEGADMVVATFTEAARVRVIQPAIYRPLVAALLPEAVGVAEPTPIAGFRALVPRADLEPLPPGYGLETHLNLRFALLGRTVTVVDLGEYRGRVRGYANIPRMARDITDAILDTAESAGRIVARTRPRWRAWVQPVLDFTSAMAGLTAVEIEARVWELVARPLPPTRVLPARS
jgi:glucosyl-3-phosphoglycerate synthase